MPQHDSLPRVADGLFWLSLVYLSLYKLWLSSAMPFFVSVFYPEDSTWFFGKALSIRAGDWLGVAYDSHTLIKLPMYPMFLSAIASLGIHPKLAIDVLYIAACLVFVFALRHVLRSRIAVLLGFIVLLANPITFTDYWTGLLRINLSTSLIFIYLSSLIVVVQQSVLLARLSATQGKQFWLWSLVCAISLSLALYVREEAIWMVSALAPMLLITLALFIKKRGRSQVVVFWLLVLILPYSLGQYLSSKNLEYYGYDGITDMRAPQFSRAFNAILSLNTVNDDSTHYMTLETRDKLLLISDQTREFIEFFLDDKSGDYKVYGRYIGGNHASWEVRNAMDRAGYYANFAKAEAAYKAIADDIEAYCQSDAAACRKIYLSGVLIKPLSPARVISEVKTSGLKLLSFSYLMPVDRMNELDNPRVSMRRGDRAFQYTVNRFFNTNTSWDVDWDRKIGMPDIESHQNRKIKSIFKSYLQAFPWLLVLALFGLFFSLLNRHATPRLISLMMVGASAGSYSVYLLVGLFAVSGFDRLLAVSSMPIILFVAYFLAYFVQRCVDGVSFLLGRES